MVNDEGWMMKFEWWRLNDEGWMRLDEWWRLNDEGWMIKVKLDLESIMSSLRMDFEKEWIFN